MNKNDNNRDCNRILIEEADAFIDSSANDIEYKCGKVVVFKPKGICDVLCTMSLTIEIIHVLEENLYLKCKFNSARMDNTNAHELIMSILSGISPEDIRSSHLQLYWTGKGRTEPKIKLVKEAFVNWENFKDIPQGYHDK